MSKLKNAILGGVAGVALFLATEANAEGPKPEWEKIAAARVRE